MVVLGMSRSRIAKLEQKRKKNKFENKTFASFD